MGFGGVLEWDRVMGVCGVGVGLWNGRVWGVVGCWSGIGCWSVWYWSEVVEWECGVWWVVGVG